MADNLRERRREERRSDSSNYCSAIEAELRTRIEDLERRCDIKEEAIRELEAWQNKAIGYALAASSVATFIFTNLPSLKLS